MYRVNFLVKKLETERQRTERDTPGGERRREREGEGGLSDSTVTTRYQQTMYIFMGN